MNKMLKFGTPATCFEESLLLGNGFLGAAVYGGVGTERYSMNEATLWTGFPMEAENPKAKEALKKAREFIKTGNFAEAVNCIEQGFSGTFSQVYLPLCSLYIENGIEQFDTYNRTLDMETGVLKVDYTSGEQKVSRESFISNPHRAMAVRIKQKNVPLTKIYIKSDLQCSISNCDDGLVLSGIAPCCEFPVGRRAPLKDITFYYEDDARKGMRYKGVLKVKSNGEFRFNGDTIELLNATEITLYFTARTSFNGFDKHPFLDGADCESLCDNDMNCVESETFESLKSVHISDFSTLFNRTDFTLCNNESNIYTDELLKEHKSNALYELLFNLGKYLTISGSRKGGQPMNLQGIWNELVDPPWNSNYTININTEMNYMPTLALNLSECFEPYVKLATELAVNGKKIAEEWYGVKGIISHHNTDIWRMANPVGSQNKDSHVWSFYNTSFGWILWGLKEKFLIEQDYEYLNDTLYPLLTECAETYISLFIEDENGNLYLSPATSPENSFLLSDGTKCALTKHTAINNAICRDTLKTASEFSELLGEDEASKRFGEYAKRVAPYEITSDGRIMEWDTEYPEAEVEHRHVSHLYGLHPAREIAPYNAPELVEAAKKSLDVRGDKGTGWCIAWKANMWARLFDGNRALSLLDNQLTYVKPEPNVRGGLLGGTYSNMLCAHPPFQIDGNFGATSAIIEMLVQANGKDLYILPALPDKWESGSIKGIKIAGGVIIDISWENHQATEVKFNPPEKEKEYNIIYKI
ncbi:MAG: glycoside hydrolase family 95 protein [Ruminococcaceae bacterium]|nr:glycoside hydrolase family 95 protein [Oscillospiraceae bacterium]